MAPLVKGKGRQKMKISKETLIVLKNFTNINNCLATKGGNTIVSVSPEEHIIGVADVKEDFPEFAIFDMTDFLNIINIFDLSCTDFDFQEDRVVISDGTSRLEYFYSEAELLPGFQNVKPPEKIKAFADFDGEFDIDKTSIQRCLKAANIMDCNAIRIKMEDGQGTLKIFNDDVAGNNFKLSVSGEGNCDIKVDIDNIHILPGSYTISVKNDTVIRFANNDYPVMYFITPLIG